jgi:RNA polymerase sigma factor (TIGR02999 family)
MADLTRLLDAAAAGDRRAAADLLPLVYDDLRKLAAARMAAEAIGHTLDPTALVHEAYLRLVGGRRGSSPPDFANRGHFFAAAAEAMRRILVDNARRKQTEKHGGDRVRVELPGDVAAPEGPSDDLLALDDALAALGRHDPDAARLVTLRYFAGLSHQDAAAAMGVSRGTADRLWALARAWLYRRLTKYLTDFLFSARNRPPLLALGCEGRCDRTGHYP